MTTIIDMGALVRPSFAASEFVPTKWSTAEDKAKFADHLLRFIASGFERKLFTKIFYNRLYLTFGHIAHCDHGGFWETFFDDLRGKIAFLEETLCHPCYGSADCTYSDVERAIQARLRAANVLDVYRRLRAAEVDGAERALFAKLRQKFEGEQAPSPNVAPVLHAPASAQVRRPAASEEQGRLF